mmetsp:Transcript_24046/g.45373  ORF Transcript_24046/g.45373 Transcript_24046/m.45373 type:complete len:304 (-) Transcript_24046:177-1088(-)
MSARAWPKGRGKGKDKDREDPQRRRHRGNRKEPVSWGPSEEVSKTEPVLEHQTASDWKAEEWTEQSEQWPSEGWTQEQWPSEEWPPTVPWPPQDPAWWADLASQLPAAWGTGAISSARVKGLEAILSPCPEAPGSTDAPGEFETGWPELLNPEMLFQADPSCPAPLSGYDVSARRSGGKQWVLAEERLPSEASPTDDFLSADVLLGRWVDSQGHNIHVLSTDAYNVRLLATLRKTMCPDKHLALKPVRLGGGWQCGHSILDPSWSTAVQLHWVAGDGHVTVWVRPQAKADKEKREEAEDKAKP